MGGCIKRGKGRPLSDVGCDVVADGGGVVADDETYSLVRCARGHDS